VAALGVVAFRVVGTRTTFGRHFDVGAIQNGLALSGDALNSSNAVLTTISSVSFALIGGLLVSVSLVERRLDMAAAVAVTLGGSFATTEFLKRSLHERPGVPDYLAHGFPSGHATVALALGLSFILAAATKQRTFAAVGAALYAAGMGVALVFNAWHLPSDVGGGFCMATAWAAGAAQIVRRPLERGVPGRLIVAAVVLVAAAALGALHLRPGLSFTVTSHGRLLEAAIGIAVTAAACCAAYAYAIAERSASATRS
jgi:membrane-associated phospholipid phosphatase